MENQKEFDSMSNMSGETLAPPNERQSNTDPREQIPAQEYTSRPYEEGHEQGYEQGYTGLDERDFWPYEGEKLRPEPKNQKRMAGLLALVVLMWVVFLGGSFFGVILSWLTWVVVIVLIIAGLAALATNWRVVTIPMPTRTFQIMEHARLVINTGAGAVAIRRGEEGMVSVTATKRASGIGIDTERMQINYNQYGDVLDISSRMDWSILQFGLRTGGGRIEAQHLQGQINLHTGGSPIILGNTRGQLTTETGGGRIEVSQAALSGESSLKTGGGTITFDGSLDALGSYNFRTGGGKINLSLPGDAAFSLDAKTGGGTIHNEFGGNEVGDGPHARLKLRTGGGGIHIHRDRESGV